MSEIGGANLEDQVRKAEEVHKLKVHPKVSSIGTVQVVEQLLNPVNTPTRSRSREATPSGQQLSEIPQGFNREKVKEWVENRLRTAEDTDEFRQTDSIGRLMGYINTYQFREGNYQDEDERKKLVRLDEDERKKLVQLVEIRGMLANSWLNLQVRNYEGFTALIAQFLTGERLLVLKEKLPGLVEAISFLERGKEGVENSEGIYFRLKKTEQEEIEKAFKDDVKKNIRNAMAIELKVEPEEVEPEKVESKFKDKFKDIDITLKIAKTLFNVSWMSSYYAGPVEQINGKEVLRDARIFKELDTERKNDDGDLKRYFENRKLWETRRQERIKGIGKFKGDPKDWDQDEKIRDPAANARRILNFPEEMDSARPPIGNAKSLRYAAEIYALSLPHFFGYDSLAEFMEKSDKRNDTYKWSNLVKVVGVAATALTDLVNEPLVGGEAVSDPKNFGNTIKNIGEVINKYQSYLELGYRDLFSYANSRIIESVFKFANGNSEDRRRFFPRWPKFGTWFLNSAVEAFSSKFNPDDRDELKRNLNSSDTALFRKDFGKQGASWLFKILQAFGSQVIKK